LIDITLRVSAPAVHSAHFTHVDKKWCGGRFLAPGRLIDCAKVEPFNGQLREECLNAFGCVV
jgi:hypothetical protein